MRGWEVVQVVGMENYYYLFCLGAMRQRQQAHFENVAYSQKIKEFLSSFKVQLCLNPDNHEPTLCYEYHNGTDRRRNPYKEEGFAYFPSQICTCSQDNCQRSHNMYQLVYHPLKYKTSKCYNYPCPYGFICYSIHDQEVDLISKYQFFRFNLDTFKTDLCPHRDQPSNCHQLASCHYYHNESDKRRNPHKIPYSHVQCSKNQCHDPMCLMAHNKIEQLYHPSRYKTKYCQAFINKKSCQYNEYCSFAHSNAEIKIQLLHQLEKDQPFYDYKYKTVWCPYTNPHDRGNCSYAHNFQDYRRDPKKKHYTVIVCLAQPEVCPYWTKGEIKSIQDAGCPLLLECPKSHGWLQKKYHPERRRWESGSEHQSDKPASTKTQSKEKHAKVKNKITKEGSFVLGAPFFKRDEKLERSQSQAKGSKIKENNKKNIKDKGFNFSFFLPDHDSLSNENNENEPYRTEAQALWRHEEDIKTSKPSHKSVTKNSTMKYKISKKQRAEYTKSLKQLLVRAGIQEQKLDAIKVNQIKLLSLSPTELDKFGLSTQEKQLLQKALIQYTKEHKAIYTQSMVKLFRSKALHQTLQKLKAKGVSQSLLQDLSNSSIEELSFLEEDEKSTLPKILEYYADNKAFQQFNSEIERQVISRPTKLRSKRTLGWHSFKT